MADLAGCKAIHQMYVYTVLCTIICVNAYSIIFVQIKITVGDK